MLLHSFDCGVIDGTARSEPEARTTDGDRAHYDLVVLGGGVIGLASLRAIMRRHPRIRAAVIDAPTAAMPASQAAAGMLAPYAEFGEDSPLARACERSLNLYHEFLETLTTEQPRGVTFVRTGTLIPDVADEHERFEARLQSFRARGIAYRVIEGNALRAAEPNLSRRIDRAIWLPEAIVNSRELHAALREWAMRGGVQWIEARPVERIEAGKRLAGLRLDNGIVMGFEHLIAATGAWSSEVAELLNLHFDIQPIKGQMTRVAAPDDFLHHVVHLRSLYLAPRPGQGIIIGSTMEEKGFDVTIDGNVMEEFVAHADIVAPGLADFPIAECWAGLRPRSSDGMPIIGWSPRWDNVLVATGHFRNGILLTPLTADIVAKLFDRGSAGEWKIFSPARFEC